MKDSPTEQTSRSDPDGTKVCSKRVNFSSLSNYFHHKFNFFLGGFFFMFWLKVCMFALPVNTNLFIKC